MKKILSLLIFLGIFLISMQGVFASSVSAGFDPGMDIARISTGNPTSQYYFESCPDGYGGHNKCYGNIPAGEGFYILANDFQQCKVNTGELYSPNTKNQQVPCPFYFNWKNQGNLIANLKLNTLNFNNSETPNMYLGIQENIGGQVEYYGIDFWNETQAPKISDIDKINLKFRTKLCYEPQKQDAYRYGRVMYYLGWWNVEKQKGETLSIDLLQFSRVPVNFSTIALVEYAENEAILANISPSSPYYENALHTIHINGKSLNIVPENYDFTLDNSADCSGNIENSPWLGVEIDIPQLLSTLESEGHLDSSILNNAKYSSSIIGGLEFWGRNLVELEVKDYTIYVKSNQQNQTQNNQTTTNQTQANNTQTNQTQQQTQASCQNSADVGNLRCSPVYNAYDWCQEYQGKIQWLLKDYCGDGEGCIGSECVSLEDIPYLEIEDSRMIQETENNLIFKMKLKGDIPENLSEYIAYVWALDTDRNINTSGLTYNDIGSDYHLRVFYDDVTGDWNGVIDRLAQNDVVPANNFWFEGDSVYINVSKEDIDYSEQGFYLVSHDVAFSSNPSIYPKTGHIGYINGEELVFVEPSLKLDQGFMQIPAGISSDDAKLLCGGCLIENNCYAFGYRKGNDFCDETKEWSSQKDSGSVCENSFQCESNICIDNECISLNVWQKFINWLKTIFG